MHGKICPCANCRGPAGTALLAVVAVVAAGAVTAAVWVWLAAAVAVVAVMALGLAWLSRRLRGLSVAVWNSRLPDPRRVLLPKAPLPAVEAAPELLAIEGSRPGLPAGVTDRRPDEQAPVR